MIQLPTKKHELSIVIPVYNEKPNIIPLCGAIYDALNDKYYYEIIFVDDGSTDGTKELIHQIMLDSDYDIFRAVMFKANKGQTAAMMAGYKIARAPIVITMDGDLQNDPHDIPALIAKLKEGDGYDLVCGWRADRKDPLSKKIPSAIASLVRNLIAKDVVHDSGCTLKAFNKTEIHELNLYGENHRFIPLILSKEGYRVTEIKVAHHPRTKGKTKYGIKRLWRGLFDMMAIMFWYKYAKKPLHFFGGIGALLIAVSLILIAYILIMDIFIVHTKLVVSPLLLASVMGIIIGIQLILFGFLGELIIRK